MIDKSTTDGEQRVGPRHNEFAALVFEVELIAETLRELWSRARCRESPTPVTKTSLDAIVRQLQIATNRALVIRAGNPKRLDEVHADRLSAVRTHQDA